MTEIDMNSDTFKRPSVKVIITIDNTETVYDIPIVENFGVETTYEDAEISNGRPFKFYSDVMQELSFTMRPKKTENNSYYTITQTTIGVKKE